jgi:hypothetical protein
MQALKERILAEGKNLGGGILKVDSFINKALCKPGCHAGADGGDFRDRPRPDDWAILEPSGCLCP